MVRRGFTLIELLVTTVLTVVIGLALYHSLSNGIMVWEWLQANKPQEDTVIFIEKLAQDIRNYCAFSVDSFEGTDDTLRFFVHDSRYLLLSRDNIVSLGKTGDDGIVRVEYLFDGNTRDIVRNEYLIGADKPRQSMRLVRGVDTIRYRFYSFNETRTAFLESRAAQGKPPQAIGVMVEVVDYKKRHDKIKTVLEVPFSG